MSRKKLISGTIAILIIAAIIFGIGQMLKSNKETLDENAKLSQQFNEKLPVNADSVQMYDFNDAFSTDGEFIPNNRVTVISDAQGKVTQLNIKEGSYVTKGTVLAVLDHTLLENQLASIEIYLEKSGRDLTRTKQLETEGAVTVTQREDLEVGIKQYENQIATIKKQIADTYLRAPISGTVVSKTIEHGSYVGPGSVVAEIVNINPLKFKTFLTEDEVFKVKSGDKIKLSTDLYGDKMFEGTITFIDVAAGNTKSYLVEITTPNSDSKFPLKAGVSGRANFSPSNRFTELAMPRSALVGGFDNAQAYVIENEVAVLKKIEVGSGLGNYIPVKSGLQRGDMVVTNGQINLKDQSKVFIATQEVAKQ